MQGVLEPLKPFKMTHVICVIYIYIMTHVIFVILYAGRLGALKPRRGELCEKGRVEGVGWRDRIIGEL